MPASCAAARNRCAPTWRSPRACTRPCAQRAFPKTRCRWSRPQIVPRGGKDLIERVMRESRIPMIKHLDGVCHVYIDDRADVDKAIRIADNAKTQRYGVCNAMETLLVNESIAPKVLPRLAKIYGDKGVE